MSNRGSMWSESCVVIFKEGGWLMVVERVIGSRWNSEIGHVRGRLRGNYVVIVRKCGGQW